MADLLDLNFSAGRITRKALVPAVKWGARAEETPRLGGRGLINKGHMKRLQTLGWHLRPDPWEVKLRFLSRGVGVWAEGNSEKEKLVGLHRKSPCSSCYSLTGFQVARSK